MLSNNGYYFLSSYTKLKDKYRKIIIVCELCDSNNYAILQQYGRIAEPGVYGKLQITICKNCGFKIQNPRYEDQFYLDYYDKFYREIAFGDINPNDEYIEQQKKRGLRVLEYVKQNNITGGTMLDHGCASGATMLSWRDNGWETYGIDPHRPSVLIGQKLGLNIEIATGEKLPFVSNKFNLLLSLGSFEHSYDLHKTMSEANRVLNDVGHLVIRWRSNKIFGSTLEYYNHNHYRFFTLNTWKLCLKKYGFKITNSTDKKLEGWDGYDYIIARKVSNSIRHNTDELVASGLKDNYKEEILSINNIRDKYFQQCKLFIKLCEEYKDREYDLIQYIRSKKSKLELGFLGGKAVNVIERSKMEAVEYIDKYNKGLVI